jgi:hypothetical protein
MRLARPGSLQLMALSLVVVLAGCGSDNTGPANPPPPAGTYSMTSFQNPPNPAVTPPNATGTLVLTATTYNVTIDVQGQGEVQDEGTYTMSGNNWTQISTTNPGVQSTGTFSYTTATGVLKTDVTASGFRTITIWQKQ